MAHVFRVGVAETSTTIGTADFVLDGRVYGALAGFFDVMSVERYLRLRRAPW